MPFSLAPSPFPLFHLNAIFLKICIVIIYCDRTWPSRLSDFTYPPLVPDPHSHPAFFLPCLDAKYDPLGRLSLRAGVAPCGFLLNLISEGSSVPQTVALGPSDAHAISWGYSIPKCSLSISDPPGTASLVQSLGFMHLRPDLLTLSLPLAAPIAMPMSHRCHSVVILGAT